MKKTEYYLWRAYKDWYKSQTKEKDVEWKTWLHEVPELCVMRAPGHTCLGALRNWNMGRVDKPINTSKGCGGVMRVAPVGLYFEPGKRMNASEVYMLGAQASAITHGHPLGFIPAAALVYIINRISYENVSLNDVLRGCIEEMRSLFDNYNETDEFIDLINKARDLAEQKVEDHAAIALLGEGWVAEETLAIAVYCCLKYNDNFEKAIIAAVNHNGDSDSTGAVAGNILGTLMGYDSLPEYYIKNLECLDVISEIAEDLYNDYTESEVSFDKGGKSWEYKYLECRSAKVLE